MKSDQIHPAARVGFALRAQTYAEARPDFPANLVPWLRDEIGLGQQSQVLDLGAGTGKFLPTLLATGATATAAEPVIEMREQLSLRFPSVRTKAATAEHLTFPAASFDAVVCAQSFHWFANRTALASIAHVLKPGGALLLIWNVRDTQVPWVAEVGRLIERFAGDAPSYRSEAWRQLFPADGFSPLACQTFAYGHSGPAERVIVDRMLSISYIAALPAAEQGRVVADLRAIIAAEPGLADKDAVTMPYETQAFWCRRL